MAKPVNVDPIEYLLQELDPDKSVEDLQQYFNVLGEDGWLLAYEFRRSNLTKIIGVFYRRIPSIVIEVLPAISDEP
jgi:hypothetical protein